MNSISNVNILENLHNETCERVQGKHVGHHQGRSQELEMGGAKLLGEGFGAA